MANIFSESSSIKISYVVCLRFVRGIRILIREKIQSREDIFEHYNGRSSDSSFPVPFFLSREISELSCQYPFYILATDTYSSPVDGNINAAIVYEAIIVEGNNSHFSCFVVLRRRGGQIHWHPDIFCIWQILRSTQRASSNGG